jgi:acyl-CoA thioester hydrolase
MEACFEYPHTVGPDEIDEQGHANNVFYLQWMQDAALAHSAALGWTPERYRALGCGWVVRSHAILYHQPAFAGDRLVVRTWVASMKKVTSVRCFRIVRQADETLLAEAETHWAFVNYDSRQLTPVPREIIDIYPILDAPHARTRASKIRQREE